ncbi:MAG TPA: hypothetical protein VGL06_18710 [Pseudonocardiaceae bacterium]|jgi:peptidoglycan/LPS O-acetylase OafA/YrhL
MASRSNLARAGAAILGVSAVLLLTAGLVAAASLPFTRVNALAPVMLSAVLIVAGGGFLLLQRRRKRA